MLATARHEPIAAEQYSPITLFPFRVPTVNDGS